MANIRVVMLFLAASITGQSFAAKLPYIINGDDVTDATRWPWQGSLRFHGSHSCGCALLSDQWALTAAHCLGAPPIAYEVYFGSVNRKEGGQTAYLDKQIVHEDFGGGEGKWPNDIGLIKFESPLTLGDKVKPVTLTTVDHTGNTDCYITGWGFTTTGGSGSPSEILQEAQIPVESNESCAGTWPGDIGPGHVCVWDPQGKKTSCNGDSGGPLVCKSGSKYELVGVMSWSISSCYPQFWPAVYTRVSYYSEWIATNMD